MNLKTKLYFIYLVFFIFLLGVQRAPAVEATTATSTSTKANALDLAELTRWSETLSHELLGSCSQMSREKWIKQYSDLENKIIERVSGFSSYDWKQIPKSSFFRDFFEIVFPQDLPKNYPMRGAFASCFSYFEDYKKTPSDAVLPEAVKSIEECYQERYKKNPPAVLEQYLSCLKSIKGKN